MAKKEAPPKFPNRIFVHYEQPNLGPAYLEIDRGANADDTEDGEQVAVYELREVKVKRVTHELVES